MWWGFLGSPRSAASCSPRNISPRRRPGSTGAHQPPCAAPNPLAPARVKPLYRNIHIQHHDHGYGDLHVFQTADMHFVEAFALTMGGPALSAWFWGLKGAWWPWKRAVDS